jgi:hypothetical protein
MKPTQQQVMQWAVSAQLVGTTRDYTQVVAPRIERFAELAYQSGAEGEQRTCNWQHDPEEGYWAGDCGIAFCIENETPELNEMHYCPKCGGKLVTSEVRE